VAFLKFYGLVFREALRHSLDIAQAVIFVAIVLGGLIAARNPSLKPMIDGLDLGGSQIATIVLCTIVAIRLILAPYWLWKSAAARNVIAPERSIDFKLTVSGFANRNDKKQKAIQMIFVLHNSSYFHSIAYEVEEIYAEVDGKSVEALNLLNRGEIIPPTSKYNFDYPWIFLKSNKWIKPGTSGHASVTYKYGIAGQPFTRRVRAHPRSLDS
jgi:hypothetical protein